MNTKTGTFREILSGEVPDKCEIEVKRFPLKSCKKCHGRGWVGRNIKTGLLIPCACVMRP